MNRSRLLSLGLALLLGAIPVAAADTLVVIINPESGVTKLSKNEVVEIFMGRQKHLSSGLVVLPVEQVAPGETRARFYDLLVKLPLPQVRAYWARLYFSGQAQPPRQTETPEETLHVVAANKGAIGFLEASKVDRSVRVVLRLGE